MTVFRRYAIYHIPPPSPLADFLARWLGWDMRAGITRTHPVLGGLPAPVADLTCAPRRYGAHATLKPPFRLAAGHDEAGLRTALTRLAARRPPAGAVRLRLGGLGGFLALTPEGDTQAIADLAAACVRDLDQFRAPPMPADLARRHATGFDAHEEENLRRWGYPYVMGAFRYHFTLTGQLGAGEAAATRAVLAPVLEPLLAAPLPITDIALAGEDAEGRFHEITRAPLSA